MNNESNNDEKKKVIMDQLAQNPKYDANWIDIAADLIANYEEEFDFDKNKLSKFSDSQLTIIKEALDKFGDDIEYLNLLTNFNLNITQMQIIHTAKTNNVSNEWIKIIANPELPYNKANYICQGMIDGYNMADIIDIFEYDVNQIFEILAGIETGVDYKLYLDSDIPAEKMGIIRHCLQLGLSIKIEKLDNKSIELYIA